MDLKKELTINSTIKTLLLKYLLHSKDIEIFMVENEIDVPLASIMVIGYEYEPGKNDIVATLVYPDACSDNGIGMYDMNVGFDEFQSYVNEKTLT